MKGKFDGGLGLKNMQSFNLALLAKQGWRILQNSESLLAKILKSKYYPHCDLLSAPEKINALFLWKSIHSSLGILRRGTSFDSSTNMFSCNMSRT